LPHGLPLRVIEIRNPKSEIRNRRDASLFTQPVTRDVWVCWPVADATG